jgi:hypothetical protein
MSPATRRDLVHVRGSVHEGEAGVALPAAMFALVAASILAAGMVSFADLSGKAALNQERATRTVQVADAGVSHALGLVRQNLKTQSFTRLLRGADNVPGSADDSLFIGYGLAANDEIPLAGKPFQAHTYFVTVQDDPSDGDANAATDLNGRVLVRCRVVANDGGTAEVTAILGSVPMPALAADGNVVFSGTPQILGACGGAHANGNIHASGGGPIVSTQASATGAATGTWKLPNGSAAPVLSGQPEVVIPDLAPMDYCTGAEFRLTATGGVMIMATGVTLAAPQMGWSYNAGTKLWSLSGPSAVNGTYCVEGNVYVGGSTGTPVVPTTMTILATGSITFEGTPYIRADHEDGILMMAGGDVAIAGNPAGGALSYQGMIYAGAQCKVSGQPRIFGQLLCANGPQPLNAQEIVLVHEMSGNFTLTFDCSSNVFNKRRILYWYPRIGA